MCDFAQNRAQSYTLLYNKTNNGVYFFLFFIILSQNDSDPHATIYRVFYA